MILRDDGKAELQTIIDYYSGQRTFIIVTAVLHAIFYFYPCFMFTKWAMNDTKATRIGMYNGLFFQFVVSSFTFGVFVIIFFLSYNWMQYVF